MLESAGCELSICCALFESCTVARAAASVARTAQPSPDDYVEYLLSLLVDFDGRTVESSHYEPQYPEQYVPDGWKGRVLFRRRRWGYDDLVQVKGNSFRGFIAALRRLHGEATAQKVIALLPVELGRRIQRDNIVTGHWYPLEELRLVQQAMMRVVGRGSEIIRAIARESTLEDFRGLYQVLTFMLTPQFIIKRTPGIWRRYYDGGIVSVTARQEIGRASCRERV